jgi:alkylation response protein AidB-like acyl-CoA dehydrogenase
MDFGLSEEQVMLKTSARDFLEKECPKRLVRQMIDDERGYSPELWKKMAELGWQGLVIPEEFGGAGSSFLDLAVLLEEMGRALLPGPFVSTVVHCARPIAAFGTDEQKRRLLPGIASGNLIMTMAHTETEGGLEASEIAATARNAGSGFVINGRKMFVPDAHAADYFLCVARTKRGSADADGISIFLVDAKAEGIAVRKLRTISGEKLCEMLFNDVSVPASAVLGEVDRGWTIVSGILQEAQVAESAWMTGGARWVLEASVQYACTRVQFGVPIGSFQAIQHKCADMAVEVEGATSAMYYAAWAIAENDPQLPLASSIAKAWCSDTFKHAATNGIQIHGGIGYTWDHDMHLYLKRAKASEVAFGDADYHRERVAHLLNI